MDILDTLNSRWVGALIFGGIGWLIAYRLDRRLQRQLEARRAGATEPHEAPEDQTET